MYPVAWEGGFLAEALSIHEDLKAKSLQGAMLGEGQSILPHARRDKRADRDADRYR